MTTPCSYCGYCAEELTSMDDAETQRLQAWDEATRLERYRCVAILEAVADRHESEWEIEVRDAIRESIALIDQVQRIAGHVPEDLMSRSTPEGLPPHGSTEQTIAIAEALSRSSVLRHKLTGYLETMGTDITYSGQREDRQAALAQFLADIMRAHA